MKFLEYVTNTIPFYKLTGKKTRIWYLPGTLRISPVAQVS